MKAVDIKWVLQNLLGKKLLTAIMAYVTDKSPDDILL